MTTISLCMIARDEEEVLERCLKSVIEFPDEVIFVDTGSTDKTVEIAKSFEAKVYHFEWIEDFSAARNFSFSKATCDYILWLDADDLIKPEELEKFKLLKPTLCKDIYVMTYDYAQDEYGNCISPLDRERIIRNDPRLRWKFPIHEVIPMDCVPNLTWEKVDITITHKRTGAGYCADLDRNINMLERALESAEYKDDPRLRYYLAKEYHDASDIEGSVDKRKRLLEKAIEEFKTYLEQGGSWWEEQVCAQFRLSQCQQALALIEPDAMIKLTLQQEARQSALKAIEFDDRWAEPYYVLGLLAWDRNDYHSAIRWFEVCRRMPLPNALSPLRPDFYGWLPNLQLCVMYSNIGDNKTAYERNEEALQEKPNDPRILHNRIYLKSILSPKKRPSSPVKLNLGSGSKRYGDYINCDLFPGQDVDEVFSLHEIPYADSTVLAIHSEHALEHLPQIDALAALREWHRVLVPGGEVHLQMPDLKHCCEKYVEAVKAGNRRLQEWHEMTIFGRQTTNGKDDPGQYHHCGFTIDSIKKELESIGFVIDYTGNYDGYDTPSLEVRAVKPISDVKIGWIGAGLPLEVPQYRIRTHHIDRWLRSRGYRSKIISYDEVGQYDVIVFGRGANDYSNMVAAKKKGKRVIYDLCEALFEFGDPDYVKAIECAGIVVCCSTALANLVKEHTKQKNVMVIRDAVEADFHLNCPYQVKDKIIVGWIGMGGNAHHVEKLRPLIEGKLGYKLVTIHEHDSADTKWDINTWQQELVKCDIAIAPLDIGKQPAKSNNKVTTYMSLGLPVVASPLPAYKEAIEHGVSGYLADGEEEWEEALRSLRYIEERQRIGQAGKQTAREYGLDKIGKQWADLLTVDNVDRTVDIIVTTYGGTIPGDENEKYLKTCLKSIEACTEHPYNVIVVDAKVEGSFRVVFGAKEFLYEKI